MNKSSTHCNKVLIKILLRTVVLLAIIISPIQTEEIKTTWNDNRLYSPTNSVYEVPKAPLSVYQPNTRQSHEQSDEEDAGAGEVYDDDYTHEKDAEERPETEEYEYFYDDYDNGTYSQTPDTHADIVANITSSNIEDSEREILISEAVVSVVTTKSVVNGTFSVPTPLPMTTEQMMLSRPPTQSPVAAETTTERAVYNSTEDTIIVASVQTSRSISGARFLPFNLNLDDSTTSKDVEMGNKSATESTESIMDKLDQVQSELSSGFLNGGFRTVGNALQLNVPIATTTREPTLQEKAKTELENIEMNDAPVSDLPKIKFKIPWPGSPRARPSSTERSRSTKKSPLALPPLPSPSSSSSSSSLLSDILARSKINIASLLPADYKPRAKIDEPTVEPVKSSLESLFASSKVDISAFVPAGFALEKKETTTLAPIAPIAPKSGGIKLIFPSRPGGRKAAARVTTAAPVRPTAPAAAIPKIQKGWATRSTTEFTGWPSPSTTPISIEKLLEAARTATMSVNSSVRLITTSEVSTTSTTTTTTTTTVRPTTPGVCYDEECEVAGTIRIIDGNATWVPELLNRNTREWQQLADDIEKQMNLVFKKSATLRKWYKRVRIDAFSPGSILVDYFIEFHELSQRINTQELKILFHDSLMTYSDGSDGSPVTTRLGNFVIDPKFTDFVVIPKVSLPEQVEKDDRLIPQWAIAVIVIGVGGLVFIIIFGVSVLVNRQNNSKLKPTGLAAGMYGEDAAKNIIQSNHLAASSHRSSSQDYPTKSEVSTIWNDDNDAWREKSFESNSHNPMMLPGEKKYNVYDSWRSEWNGYYYQPSHSSSKFTPDYDPNF